MPARPRIAISTGNVISFSTSTAPSPGASVTTWTTLGVTSGAASIGSSTIARNPSATRTTNNRNVMRRFSSAASKSHCAIAAALLHARRRAVEQHRLERHAALRHHLFARAQPGDYLDRASRRVAKHHLAHLETIVARGDE